MSINETIIQAVTPIVPVCVPDVYRPDGRAVGDYTNASDLEGQHYVLECRALDLEVG